MPLSSNLVRGVGKWCQWSTRSWSGFTSRTQLLYYMFESFM
jgi:hypothetical protein